MILVQLVTDEEGQYTGVTKNTPVSVHHKLMELWKKLLTEGLITQVRVISVPGAQRALVSHPDLRFCMHARVWL